MSLLLLYFSTSIFACTLLSFYVFSATVCKTVRPMLSDRCLSVLSCLSVCDVRALWPNGWTDQNETRHAVIGLVPGHIVLDGDPAPPPQKGIAPQFSAHICCGQITAWIEMSLGMELGLCPGDFVLDGDPAPPPQKGAGAPSPNFRPIFIVAKRLDG